MLPPPSHFNNVLLWFVPCTNEFVNKQEPPGLLRLLYNRRLFNKLYIFNPKKKKEKKCLHFIRKYHYSGTLLSGTHIRHIESNIGGVQNKKISNTRG